MIDRSTVIALGSVVMVGCALASAYKKNETEKFEETLYQHFETARQVLVDEMVMNLFFLNVLPMNQYIVTYEEYRNLYVMFKSYLQIRASNYDVICEQSTIEDESMSSKRQEVCSKMYIGDFAVHNTFKIPSFVDNCVYTMHGKGRPTDVMIDLSLYPIKKSQVELKKPACTYDRNFDLLRLSITNPYIVLTLPFVVEIAGLGYFNVMYDIPYGANSRPNAMNYFDTSALAKESATNTVLLLKPVVPSLGSKLLNTYSAKYNLEMVAERFQASDTRHLLTLFYLGQPSQWIQPIDDAHVLTLHINDKDAVAESVNSITIVGNADASNMVRNIALTYSQSYAMVIDDVDHTSSLQEIGAAIKKATQFDLIYTFAFNVLYAVLFCKVNDEHHVIYKRINVLDASKSAKAVVFSFPPDLTSASSYKNIPQAIRRRMYFGLPDYTKLAFDLSYSKLKF